MLPDPIRWRKNEGRIGISFPLEAESPKTLTYRYPTIAAENFTISEQLQHSVWYEEKTSAGLLSHSAADMTMSQLHSTQGTIQAASHPLATNFTSAHPTAPNERLTFTAKRPSNELIPAPHASVIDGSRAMQTHQKSIATWASHYNETLQIYFAGDEVHTFQGTGKPYAQWIQQQGFVGGQDNVHARTEAIRALLPAASAETPQQLFWFSGPQPIQLSGTEKIRQLFERRELPLDIVACLTSRDYNALDELAPPCPIATHFKSVQMANSSSQSSLLSQQEAAPPHPEAPATHIESGSPTKPAHSQGAHTANKHA